MQGYRVLDLNIFYREDWSPETGTTWSETFTIDPYIYESDGNGVRKYDTDVLIECDAFETQWLAEQFPEDEYGSDWWVFADQTQLPSRRIKRILDGIQIDQFDQEPSITDSSTM
jgi:hypothetical protein